MSEGTANATLSMGRYIGDGVYVIVDEHNAIILTTGSHYGCEHPEPTNTIVLEPEVWEKLAHWYAYLPERV
jgi:hypothetical protein